MSTRWQACAFSSSCFLRLHRWRYDSRQHYRAAELLAGVGFLLGQECSCSQRCTMSKAVVAVSGWAGRSSLCLRTDVGGRKQPVSVTSRTDLSGMTSHSRKSVVLKHDVRICESAIVHLCENTPNRPQLSSLFRPTRIRALYQLWSAYFVCNVAHSV